MTTTEAKAVEAAEKGPAMTDEPRAALKPCPFCNNEPVLFCIVDETDETNSYSRGYTVQCEHCGVELTEEYKAEEGEAMTCPCEEKAAEA